jgi:hypothetical protein
MAYTWLDEDLEGEVGKGVLTRGVILRWHVSTRRRRRWGTGGVVEVAGEVVGEEFLSGTELMAGTAGSGNNRRAAGGLLTVEDDDGGIPVAQLD